MQWNRHSGDKMPYYVAGRQGSVISGQWSGMGTGSRRSWHWSSFTRPIAPASTRRMGT